MSLGVSERPPAGPFNKNNGNGPDPQSLSLSSTIDDWANRVLMSFKDFNG